jgi:hypothetical protein
MAHRWRLDYAAQKHDTRAPIVVVEVVGTSGRAIPVRALVDSGADFSTFPIEMMKPLGLYKSHCHKVDSETASGKAHCYICKEPLEANFRGESFDLIAAFMPGLKIPLLGRNDFFEHFKVSFNERDSKLTLTTYD